MPYADAIAATVYLHPGQVFTTTESLIVTTILGSCVAVCVWDPAARIAGINHYLLPSTPLRGSTDLRFGNVAIERLLDDMAGRGAKVQRLVAKVFGGACVIGNFTGKQRAIGAANVDVARELLAKHDITIVGEQTGGARGRKLHYHTAGGSAYVKEI